MRVSALALASGVLALVVLLSCTTIPSAQRCRDIPAGGCPGQGPDNCKDPTCAAIYTCEPDGTWVLDQPCPPNDGGLDASDGSLDAPHDVPSIDAPEGAWGGPGCPDLQLPDCPLGVALACNADCCGCVDLFVCGDAGWNLWGQCFDGGVLAGD